MKGNEGFSELMTIRAKMLVPKITSASEESISTEKRVSQFMLSLDKLRSTLRKLCWHQTVCSPLSFVIEKCQQFESALTKQMEHVLPKQVAERG